MSAVANSWNHARPIAPGDSTMSHRASAVYSWMAGLYAFAVPWSDMLLLPYQVQFSRPLALLAVVCLIFSWRAGNTLRRPGFPVGAMALFIALVPAHLLSTADPERTARRLVSYLGLFLMTLFIQQCVRTRKAHLSLLGFYIAGCCVLLANLGWNVMLGNVQGDGRYAASNVDPNDLAGQIALSIPIASYLAFTLRRRAFWFRLYLPLAVVGVLLTASRAGLVAMVIASLYPLIFLLMRMRRGRLSLVIAIFATALAVNYLAPNISFHRLATLRDQILRGDMNGRGAVWVNGLALYWENPLFGVGAGGFSGSVGGGNRIAAHNTYLEVLVEHGAVGLTLFLAIVFGLLFRARRFPVEERLLWWTVLGAWMVLILTLSWENREYTWLVWALCLSFVPPPSHPAEGGFRGL